MSKILKTFGYTTDEILPQMQKIGNAAAALGHTSEDMQWVSTYIGRMRATDKRIAIVLFIIITSMQNDIL